MKAEETKCSNDGARAVGFLNWLIANKKKEEKEEADSGTKKGK